MAGVVILIIIGLAAAVSIPAVWDFFQGVSNTWFWDISPPPQAFPSGGFPYDPALYDASTPIARTVLHEVQTGWSIDTILAFWGPWFPLAVFLCLLLGTGIIYCVVRILQIRRVERGAMAAGAHPVAAQDIPRTQLRWRRILEQVSSDDEQKWRLAIMEADIMLNDLLDVLGYKGETMADKMKRVTIEAFNTIDFAWEAHKIRNRIVHDGDAYTLDTREANRVIRMYERVLKEFKYIE